MVNIQTLITQLSNVLAMKAMDVQQLSAMKMSQLFIILKIREKELQQLFQTEVL